MGLFLRGSNGFPRSFSESSTVTIYDQRLTIVSGAPANSNEMTGPVTSGTNITLPQSGTYEGSELQVYFNGTRIEVTSDYAYVGSGTKTQIQMTFDLVVGDTLDFRVDRAP